jgi:hypothetical protein
LEGSGKYRVNKNDEEIFEGMILSFRDASKTQDYDVQLHIGESRDSGSGANAPSRNDER